MNKSFTRLLTGSLLLSTFALSGCAQNPPKNDPFEGYNRVMYAFNTDIDHLAIRPIAKVYSIITPPPLKKGVTNFFANIDETTTFGNDLLQGNFKYLAVDFWRFAINSTLGIGGLFDVATRMGIKPHVENFSLTLAKWRGGKASPYFIVPLLGPATVQSAIGLGADFFMTPWPYLNDQTTNYIATGTRLISIRARLLPADKVLATSFDPYVFVRNAYLQHQNMRIRQNEALGKAVTETEDAADASKIETKVVPHDILPIKPVRKTLPKKASAQKEAQVKKAVVKKSKVQKKVGPKKPAKEIKH